MKLLNALSEGFNAGKFYHPLVNCCFPCFRILSICTNLLISSDHRMRPNPWEANWICFIDSLLHVLKFARGKGGGQFSIIKENLLCLLQDILTGHKFSISNFSWSPLPDLLACFPPLKSRQIVSVTLSLWMLLNDVFIHAWWQSRFCLL